MDRSDTRKEEIEGKSHDHKQPSYAVVESMDGYLLTCNASTHGDGLCVVAIDSVLRQASCRCGLPLLLHATVAALNGILAARTWRTSRTGDMPTYVLPCIALVPLFFIPAPALLIVRICSLYSDLCACHFHCQCQPAGWSYKLI